MAQGRSALDHLTGAAAPSRKRWYPPPEPMFFTDAIRAPTF